MYTEGPIKILNRFNKVIKQYLAGNAQRVLILPTRHMEITIENFQNFYIILIDN